MASLISRFLGFPQDRPLTEDERRTVLRAIVSIAIPLALITLLATSVLFFYGRHLSNERIKEAKTLTIRLNQERIQRARAINDFIYEQCIEAEVRDVVITEQSRIIIRTLKALLPNDSLIRQDAVIGLQAGIDALEPPNEPDCTPPPVNP